MRERESERVQGCIFQRIQAFTSFAIEERVINGTVIVEKINFEEGCAECKIAGNDPFNPFNWMVTVMGNMLQESYMQSCTLVEECWEIIKR